MAMRASLIWITHEAAQTSPRTAMQCGSRDTLFAARSDDRLLFAYGIPLKFNPLYLTGKLHEKIGND
jgi:hypothetical protein